MTWSSDPLDKFSLEEIVTNLESRGFGREHKLELADEFGWFMEHPLSCRLGQLKNGVMYSLAETCRLNLAFRGGMDVWLRQELGAGHFGLYPDTIDELIEEWGGWNEDV